MVESRWPVWDCVLEWGKGGGIAGVFGYTSKQPFAMQAGARGSPFPCSRGPERNLLILFVPNAHQHPFLSAELRSGWAKEGEQWRKLPWQRFCPREAKGRELYGLPRRITILQAGEGGQRTPPCMFLIKDFKSSLRAQS